MRIIFINYGLFASNSGGHIAHFANCLAAAGHTIGVCADGDPNSLSEMMNPLFHMFNHDEIDFDLQSILTCGDKSIGLDQTILHAWTPREKVINITKAFQSAGVSSYFVHLEDNEELLTAVNLGTTSFKLNSLSDNNLPEPFPLSLSHPKRYKQFLAGATGVTVIVKSLEEFVPSGIPVHVLEPGVDVNTFSEKLSADKSKTLREELLIDDDEAICVYHGNMHAANQREIFSLYTAFLILQRRGRRVRLIRTGRDFTDGLDISYSHLKDLNVIELGYLNHTRLIEVLKLADFFVQPGTSNVFNDYRFPSKLPEFLAHGKPVILPSANIGLRMKDGVTALLLQRGDGMEIADKIENLLDDPILAHNLGKNGQDFALTELNWTHNADQLSKFYETLVN